MVGGVFSRQGEGDKAISIGKLLTKSLEELYTKHVEVASRGKAKATEKGRPASLDERLLRAYAEATYCTGTVCKRLNLPARQGSCSSPDVH